MRFLHFTLAIILAFGVLIGLSAFVQVNVSAKASDPIGLPSAFATPVVTLQSLIDAAPNGGTVNVAAGTYNESLTVNKTLTLTGVSSGTTIIQAVAGQRVIAVDNGYNLRLENLTITGGQPSGAVGGGVFVMSGSLTLINVCIAGNSANYGGGVFQSGQGGRVDATGSRIELNTTTLHGGGLYIEGTAAFTNTHVLSNTASWQGGGLHSQYKRVDISGGRFEHNRALYGNGGAINLNGSLSLSGTVIITNTALNGGGVQQWNSGYSVALTNTRFERNAARHVGGGAAVSGTLSISGSAFITNTVDSGDGSDTFGGGIYAGGASQIAGTTFAGNTAFCINGGSCSNANGGGLYIINQPLTLTQVTFARNEAGRMGGGLKTDYATTRLDRVIFSGNYAGWGAGLSHSQGSGTLNNVLFSGNVAGWGGGALIESANVTLTQATLAGNKGSNFGGGVENYWSTLRVINSVLWGNSASKGAQIYDDNPAVPTLVTYSDVQFTGIYTGVGNLNADPRFVQPIAASLNPTTTGNYHVAGNSPVIDHGTNAGLTRDLDGQPRPIGHGYDQGAYETRLMVYLPVVVKQ